MQRDYPKLLPMILAAMFPEEVKRKAVIAKLSAYGQSSYHQETERVRLGILRLTWNDPDKLDVWIDLACCDFRDLLVAAEYFHSAKSSFKISKHNPERYRKLQNREAMEYDAWIKQVLSE